MRILRGLAGALLWIVAAVVGLVGVVLCVTLIGLPLGIPLVLLARRMFTQAVLLLMPRNVAHPIMAAKDAVTSKTDDTRRGVAKRTKKLRKALA